MKTHLINYIARIGLLLMVLTGGLKTGWGLTIENWSGTIGYIEVHDDDLEVHLTGDVTLTNNIVIWKNRTLTIIAQGGARTITRGAGNVNPLFTIGYGTTDSNCHLIIGDGTNKITIDNNNVENCITVIYEMQYAVGKTCSLNNVEIRNFNGSSSPLELGCNLSCVNCVFYNNRVTGSSGGVANCFYESSDGNSGASFTNCQFLNNTAVPKEVPYGGQIYYFGGDGGAINNSGIEITLTNCVFTNNSGKNGGAICNDGGGVLNISGCTFNNNTASSYGGAIDNPGNSTTWGEIYLTGTNSFGNITPNTASSSYGGGAIYDGGQLEVSGTCFIANNTGGGVANNIYITPSAYQKYVTIGKSGLLCGSSIGVTAILPYSLDGSSALIIAQGDNTNGTAAANCALAKNFFFDDQDKSLVYYSNRSPYVNTNLYFSKSVYSLASNASTDLTTDASTNTITVKTKAGLAYIVKQVYKGLTDYSGWTIKLDADLTITTSSERWIPIGVQLEEYDCSSNQTVTVTHPFKGTFDGQGHSIATASFAHSHPLMGLFGYVEGGTIKNTFVFGGLLKPTDCAYLGGLVGYLHGGTVSNCTASTSLNNGESSTVMGGLIGKADNGAVIHSCYCAGSMQTGGIMGGVVGQLASASLLNSFAHAAFTAGDGTSNIGGLVGVNTGHIENCYVRADRTPLPNSAIYGMFAGSNTGTDNIVRCYAPNGAADQFNHSYTYLPGGATTGISNCGLYNKAVKPYLYKHNDNLVTMDGASSTSGSLLSKLNSGVTAGQTTWMRTMGSPLNADYPIPRYTGYGLNCVGKRGGFDLQYSSNLEGLFTSLTGTNTNIFIYGDAGTQANPIVTNNNANTGIYIAEDVSIIHTSTITNAHVGITLDPTNGSEGVHWHMFSPALSNAPLGINYTDNTDWPFSLTHPSGMPYYLFAEKVESTDHATYPTYGYFPSHNYGDSYPANDADLTDPANAGNYYSHWDFYTYYEPEYHWINFKRNGNSHHHEDSEHEHIDYHWDNNTSNSTSLNINEPILVKGKGYLVATDHECFLEAKGTLNQGSFTIPVTTQGAYRTGYNLLGNPYQSQFDFDKFADVNKALWGGTKTNASYVILNKDGYTYYAYSGSSNAITSTANRYLHPHQGFMIFATNSGTASFTDEMRVTGQTTTFRGNDHVDYPLINLIVTEADGNRDIATIEQGRPEAGGAIKQYDLHLGTGCIYSHYEDQDYAIAFTLPGISEVPVRFETDEDATYTLTWDMENGEFHYLHLIDNLTGIDIDCLTTTEYRFTAKASDYKSRFKLVFEYTGVEENEDGPSTGSGTFAFIMGNELVVNGEGYFQMFDLAGRLVMTETMSGTQTTAVLPDVPTGVYVIRLTNKKGTRVQKMVIEN